jgi:hypothetical protein
MIEEEFFAKLIREADDVKTSGRWAALNQKINQLADDQNGHEPWQVQVIAALCFQNFSEYIALKKAYEETESDVSLLAWRSRNLFEISIWCSYCAKTKENARVFYEDAGRDVHDTLTAFTKWGRSTSQDSDWIDPLEKAKLDISERAAAEGIESLEGTYTKIENAAQECDIAPHFRLGYKILSKFAHPTAMLIMGQPNQEKERRQKDWFYSQGCLFFVGAFNELEERLSMMVNQ